MEPAVSMVLADVFCQPSPWDELGDVWFYAASSRAESPFLRAEGGPTAGVIPGSRRRKLLATISNQ